MTNVCEPVIQRMQPYDGRGWLCYLPDGKGSNIGFGPTKKAARESWERGEDIGKAAAAKWRAMGMI